MAYSVNPQFYLERVKIHKARELLKNESVMVNDVAMKVGFLQRNAFKKIFKKFVGVTSSQFRKMSSSLEIDPRK
ncbi:MAG: helix-turn-helix domain-containing protein [Candidatus Kryptoniota bacterium]